MRREMQTFMIALVVTLTPGLSACVAAQTETAGAPVAQKSDPTPTPALTPFPVPTTPTTEDEALAQSVAPTVIPIQPTVSPAPNIVPANTVLPNAVPNDTRIVINAPAYRLDLFENGKLIKSYQIGIGYPEFPLPTGMRTANAIIFNPTWTPPDEPWVESPRSKVKVGQKVPAGSKLNPLGPVKIPIGLPSLIHGGKSSA
ncbi:MAG: L,D-transpeptidase, partial [Blastocatellia bacterium]